MLKSFKTEINPTVEQKTKINKTIGVCRYIYNFYIAYNKALYDKGEKFMTGRSFSVWLNNEYIPNNLEKIWIKEVYYLLVAYNRQCIHVEAVRSIREDFNFSMCLSMFKYILSGR